MSEEQKNALDQLISGVKQERDELQLQLHLASMEAREEFGRLSDKFTELSAQYEPICDAVEETADDVFASLQLAASEMKDGFLKIKNAIAKTISDEQS